MSNIDELKNVEKIKILDNPSKFWQWVKKEKPEGIYLVIIKTEDTFVGKFSNGFYASGVSRFHLISEEYGVSSYVSVYDNASKKNIPIDQIGEYDFSEEDRAKIAEHILKHR